MQKKIRRMVAAAVFLTQAAVADSGLTAALNKLTTLSNYAGKNGLSETLNAVNGNLGGSSRVDSVTTEGGALAIDLGSNDAGAITCVVNGKFVAFSPEPSKVGQDALAVTDATGNHIYQNLIKALKQSRVKGYKGKPGMATVLVVQNVPEIIDPRTRKVFQTKQFLTGIDSHEMHRSENDSRKVFCAVLYPLPA